MLKFKRLGISALCLLLCCGLLVLAVIPASALSFSVLPFPVASVPTALGVVNTGASTGHLASVVYRSAYAGATIIGCLENGTELTVLDTKDDYYRIDCCGMTGYIARSQVRTAIDGKYYVNCAAGGRDTRKLASYSAVEALALRNRLCANGKKYQGVPYVWGGSSPRGFDCSGFTQYVFAKTGIDINRTAVAQLENGIIIPKSELQPGDLVFFQNTGSSGRFASHVGIYIGDGKMVHAGSSTGITVSSIHSFYWSSHYLCARRMILTELTEELTMPDTGMIQKTNIFYWRNYSRTESPGIFHAPTIA